ncbi:MAG: AIR synthase related protein, partial [Verrucomicrobiota bacterium]
MTAIRDIGEFGLITQIRRQLRSRHIGDDCAVLPGTTPGYRLLYTCDPVVEGVHFLPATPARQVGWKAMAR